MLVDDAMEKCIFLDKTTEPDEYGTPRVRWKEGAEFKASFDFQTTIQMKQAAVNGVKDLYKVYTKKPVLLSAGTVFKRISNGKYYRVTTDGKDNKTPATANLNLSVADIESYIPEAYDE